VDRQTPSLPIRNAQDVITSLTRQRELVQPGTSGMKPDYPLSELDKPQVNSSLNSWVEKSKQREMRLLKLSQAHKVY